MIPGPPPPRTRADGNDRSNPRIRELEQQNNELLRQMQQIRQQLYQHELAEPQADAQPQPPQARSWLDTAMDRCRGGASMIFGGAGPPPAAIEDAVFQWPFLSRYIIESLITTGKTSWSEIPVVLANSLRNDSLLPLERVLKERWSWLPPQPQRHNYVFTAVASLKQGSIKWELRWPELVSRRESQGKTGFTKRNYERYGYDQLLFVDIPGGSDGVEIAKRLRETAPARGQGVRMLGRVWRLLSCRPESGSKKPQMVLCSSSVSSDLNGVWDTWHLDPAMNGDLTISKSLARSNMAMSSVVCTVTIPESCIVRCTEEIDDDYLDGACGISRSVFLQAWDDYCVQTLTDDVGVPPSVLQGRLGSRKGVWYLDDRLKDGVIQFRSNQQKWLIHEPTKEQRTLEVCCFGTDSGPARLNLQMLRLLELRMAEPQLLVGLLTEQLDKDASALTEFDMCEKFCRDAGDKGEAVLEKLRSGWRLEDELVQALLRKAMKERHRHCVDENKLHIRLPKSRDYIIIPDPFGLLSPGEVAVKVPGIGYLEEDVIIGRSPCYHPGELLQVKAVHIYDVLGRMHDPASIAQARKWFDVQQCVVILSTQSVEIRGEARSVADLMQGGDFDGDNVKVIWDERFVRGFKPWAPPSYSKPGESDFCHWHPLGHMKLRDVRGGKPEDAAFEYFLAKVSSHGQNIVGEVRTTTTCGHHLPMGTLTPLALCCFRARSYTRIGRSRPVATGTAQPARIASAWRTYCTKA